MPDNTGSTGRTWKGLLERAGKAAPQPTPPRAPPDPAPSAPQGAPAAPVAEPADYRAFVVDRANRRQAMLELRMFEPQTGVEEGYLVSVPNFKQAYFIGTDRVVLHFGQTFFKVEGRGVRQMVELLKQGNLVTLQEWNARYWAEPPANEPKITCISAITPEQMLAPQGGAGREREMERGRG